MEILKAPILFVDDDEEDLQIIKIIVDDLKIDRPTFYFRSGDELLEYFKSNPEPPFLILCDLNLPTETGFDIRKRMTDDSELRYKSVPFIFWSTSASEKQIQHAYDLPAQGFFFKPSQYRDLCETFEVILNYWTKSQHPKKVI